jgi:peptidoglycan hydrolase-like protein with peptidoglycan-binding domain
MARSFRPVLRSGLAAAALAATFTLSLAGTSFGATGNQGQPPSSAVVGPGAGYAVEVGSSTVRQIQRRLRSDGYATGPVDGIYGPRTAAAVRRFQQANGLVPDGVIGPQTVSAAASPRGGLVRPGAGYGSPGGDLRVRNVQRMLRTVGYDPGTVDGRFGPRTQAAVQWFQAKHGLRPSGVVDPASLIRLRELNRDRPPPSDSTPKLEAPPLPSAGWHGRPIRNPQPDRNARLARSAQTRGSVHALGLGAGYRTQDGSQQVRRIQRVLHQLGYESGPVDGRFGPRTRASVQWLQMKYGLGPTGAIDVATLGHVRALAKGEAPAQVASEDENASSARPQGKPAQPRVELANAQAVALGNNAVPLLVLALLGGLGAAAVWPRRHKRLGGA